MTNTAIIFGAGKTGRGFAAHLAFLGDYEIILVDKNPELIADLKKAGEYDIQVLNNEDRNCRIKVQDAFHIEDDRWHAPFAATGLAFTSVFGNNLEELAGHLAPGLAKRFKENPGEPLTIITCENLTGAAGVLKRKTAQDFNEDLHQWLSEKVGFSESIIFRTCLGPAEGQPGLLVRAQDFFELPCDGDAIRGELHVYGLKPLANFSNQLRRKIFTYNCINAVITYLGVRKGYTQLSEAGNDPEILETAQKAANETSLAQVAEFGFNSEEQEQWKNAAFAKFADKSVPDPIERNAADPVRKLAREDRLIGPALLALKHNIHPAGLIEAIMACFDYTDPKQDAKVSDVIRETGADFVLRTVCGLSKEEKLFTLIKERILKSN
ncbi:MAG TPA: hypothetical protein VEZ17_14310 [Chitinophagaceae bacterium]|nr:hypothetical protein [Chitinophagaceae bacterium]